MGCGVVERHLEMAQPTTTNKRSNCSIPSKLFSVHSRDIKVSQNSKEKKNFESYLTNLYPLFRLFKMNYLIVISLKVHTCRLQIL